MKSLQKYFNAFVRIPRVVLRTPDSHLLDSSRVRSLLDKYSEETRFRSIVNDANITPITLSEIFGSEIEKTQVPYGAINERTGKQNQAELFYVVATAKFIRAKNIFEFGTFTGRTTYYLACSTENTEVSTLDLPPGHEGRYIQNVGYYFAGTEQEKNIKQIFVNSREFDPLPYKSSMDFIFVDGDHSYDGVKNDTEKALTMIAPGGVIMWHDYGPSRDLGLAKYFTEFTKTRPVFHIHKTSLLLWKDGLNALDFQSKNITSKW
jgi:predicted O-methyltransferase YrrM